MPWAGRTLQPHGFGDDDGGVDAGVAAALRFWAGLEDSDRSDRPDRPDPAARLEAERAVVAALVGTRVFAPVIAELGEQDATGADKSADMALALLTRPDGTRALPLFTSLAALSTWDPRARPVPVPVATAALAGAQEDCDVLALDPAGPVAFVVRRAPFWALAREQPWTPAPLDPAVAAAVDVALQGIASLRGTRCEPGTDAELRVVLGVTPGLDREALTELTRLAGERLAADDVVTARAESLEFRILPAP